MIVATILALVAAAVLVRLVVAITLDLDRDE